VRVETPPPVQNPALAIRIVYEDSHLIELEARVHGAWTGVMRVYAGLDWPQSSAAAILAWSSPRGGELCIEAGMPTRVGWLQMIFRAIDSAGHLVCQLTMESAAYGRHPPLPCNRLSVSLHTEPALLDRFAHQLRAMMRDRRVQAVLECVDR
jgi:hypothetical protein